MDYKTLFRKKHELWLILSLGSLTVKDSEFSEALNGFAQTTFRHMKWIGESVIEAIRTFDYQDAASDPASIPTMIDLKIESIPQTHFASLPAMIQEIQKRMDELHQMTGMQKNPLFERMNSDEGFFLYRLERLYDFISGWEGDMTLRHTSAYELSRPVRMNSVLTEEMNEEYRTVMRYLFLSVHSVERDVADILNDLITESLEHMRHYARMLIRGGKLMLPEALLNEDYQISSMKEVVMLSIEEEEKEQQNLLSLADDIEHPEFQRLARFVAYQERHHIALLQKILRRYEVE